MNDLESGAYVLLAKAHEQEHISLETTNSAILCA